MLNKVFIEFCKLVKCCIVGTFTAITFFDIDLPYYHLNDPIISIWVKIKQYIFINLFIVVIFLQVLLHNSVLEILSFLTLDFFLYMSLCLALFSSNTSLSLKGRGGFMFRKFVCLLLSGAFCRVSSVLLVILFYSSPFFCYSIRILIRLCVLVS